MADLKDVKYTICSTPDHINFTCPHCRMQVDLPFVSEYWESGEIVDCPECGKSVYLGDWEYD